MPETARIDAAANAAAEWWGRACANPRFDNGDDSRNGGMAMILATLAHASRPPSPTQVLVEAIKAHLVRQLTSVGSATLSTDYGPEYQLRKIADAVGFGGDFPWKTQMTINPDAVQVACGYRAPMEKIWPPREDTNV